jgi:hypothetical protein
VTVLPTQARTMAKDAKHSMRIEFIEAADSSGISNNGTYGDFEAAEVAASLEQSLTESVATTARYEFG